MADPDVAADRRLLRQQARAARTAFVGSLSPAVRRGLERALARLALPHLPPAPAILGSYAAIADEIDPEPLEALAAARGWQLAFPRVTGDGPLAFHLASRTQLAPGFRGIPEPSADAPTANPTLLLVPLLAADRAGNRLGQGAGHYDRTLHALRSAGPAFAIGLAFDVQLLPALAAQPWDQPLDAIATPTAFHGCAGPAMGAP